MSAKEYLTINEVAIKHQVSTKTVLRRIKHLLSDVSPLMLYKDKGYTWRIHHLLIPKFRPKYKEKIKTYAFSIDPCEFYSEEDIHKIMDFVFENVCDNNLEIEYVVEQKVSNSKNHIHCLLTTENKQKILESVRLAFGKVSYKLIPAYDKAGWKGYMMKYIKHLKQLGNKLNK